MVLIAVLILNYLAFVSLGLPDGLLGSAWPKMHEDLSLNVELAGALYAMIALGTVISSLSCGKILRRMGTGQLTAISALCTALALFLFSRSTNVYMFVAAAIPLGIGAGSVDTALNQFVSLHFAAKHMHWLHCAWGIGAAMGPVIMSSFLETGWRYGYRTVSIIQMSLSALLFISLPLWKKIETSDVAKTDAVKTDSGKTDTENAAETEQSTPSTQSTQSEEDGTQKVGLRKTFARPIAKFSMLATFLYCAIETTSSLWLATFLVYVHRVTPIDAARWVSLFYLGITGGRLLSGFVSMRISSNNMIRLGLFMIALAILLLSLLPAHTLYAAIALLGLGCAPIYPALMHTTPDRIGKENTASLMGLQMTSAYLGVALMPAVFGFVTKLQIAGRELTTAVLPLFLCAYCLALYMVVKWIFRHQTQD
ncbi:MAG: MFS transporter [Treponemataceae bacterium]|nr:MAG: MFS transporter [Treponemataceae bacterium]